MRERELTRVFDKSSVPELGLQEKQVYWPYSSIGLLPVEGDEVGSNKWRLRLEARARSHGRGFGAADTRRAVPVPVPVPGGLTEPSPHTRWRPAIKAHS